MPWSRRGSARWELATRYFHETAATDLADTSNGSAGGVHIAALGGLWQAAVFGFAGLCLQNDGIGFNPKLPASWTGLKFGIEWRGRRLRISIDGAAQLFRATLEAGDPMAVFVKDWRQEVRCGQAMLCPLT